MLFPGIFNFTVGILVVLLKFPLPLILTGLATLSDGTIFRKLQVYIIQLYKIRAHLVDDKQRHFMILKLLKIMNLLLKLEILSLLLKRQMQTGGRVNSMGKLVNKIELERTRSWKVRNEIGK